MSALFAALVLICISTAGTVPDSAANSDWPSFRGPSASGIAEGFASPTTWNVESAKGVRWKNAIPGLGHSSPVVWGDRVFVTTALSGRAEDKLKVGLYG